MEKAPFNKLPAELRIKIYELVLIFDDPEGITIEPSDRGSQIEPRATCRKKIHFALIETCKQIRSEAFPVFISQNKFRVAPTDNRGFYGNLPTTIRLWLSYLGHFAQDLRSVGVSLGKYFYEVNEWEELDDDLTRVLKDTKAVFRRNLHVELSINMVFKFPETHHDSKDFHETFELELYATTLEQAKASMHKQRERFEQQHQDYSYQYDYSMEIIVRETEAYLEFLDQDPTWSWGVQTKAPIADAERSTACKE